VKVKKIVVTGATGLIGKALCKTLSERGDEITLFSTHPANAKRMLPFAKEIVEWKNLKKDYAVHLNGKDAVINLAGANIAGKRWTKSYKAEIYSSRVNATRNLIASIQKCEVKPEVFISASAVGIYGNTGEKEVTEKSNVGNDFLSHVCSDWEAASVELDSFGVRRSIMRTGVVLSKDDGALKKMLPIFHMGLGGPLGNGRQWFSWIHLADLISLYLYLLNNPTLGGVFNGTSPNPIRMKDFANTVGKVMHRPSLFPVPKFMLKLVMGESSEAVMASQKVLPANALKSGFTFTFSGLEEALRNILG